MTKTKKTDTKSKETLEDEKMKRDNELFNQKLDKINKPILEMVKELNDLMKQVEGIEKDTEEKVFESDLDYITRRLKDLSEYNEENFTELKKVAKQIQKKNLQLLDSVLNEKQFKEFKKKGKIEVAINGAINEEQKKFVEALNGKFITEKTLLIFPFWIEGGIKQNELKLFQEDFENVSKQVEEKRKLLDKYYQYQSRIILTNNQVGQIQRLFFDILPKYQGQELSKDTIDLTNENVFNFFSDIQEKINNANIEEITLFELTTDTESDYKISFIYDEEKKEARFTFEKGINTSGEIIDLSIARIKELEKENKELKEKLEKKGDIRKKIEILSDFKPIPIESQYSFNDKVSRNLVNLKNGRIAEITNLGKGKKKKGEVMKVLIENDMIETNEQVLDDFEELVLETFYSLNKKNQNIDIQMIKDQLTQQKGNRHKSELDDLIEKALIKGKKTDFKIESSEALKGTIGDFDKFGFIEPFLPWREVYVIKGGQKKSVYQLTSKPLYFDYVEAKNQLITKNNTMLQISGIKKDKNTILLIKRISDRIQDMKYQQSKNKGHSYINKIKIESLFERLDLNEENIQSDSVMKKKQRYIETITKILNDYKKKKIIKSYKLKNDIKIKLFTDQQKLYSI